MLRDDVFWTAVKITVQIFVVGLVTQTIGGLALGFLLSRDVPGRRIMQAAIVIPALTAPVAIGLAWLLIYDPTLGVGNYPLDKFGIEAQAWLGDPDLVVLSLIIVDNWQWIPFMALIIAAGIRALPTEPFEAASIDGANLWRMAWHIGIPLLRPVITVAILLRSVDLVRYFDTGYIMTQGGPVNASTTLNIYGYRKAFEELDMSYGAALQIALLVLVIIIALALTLLRGRVTEDA